MLYYIFDMDFQSNQEDYEAKLSKLDLRWSGV